MLEKCAAEARNPIRLSGGGAVAMRNFYSVLQVAPKASEAEIKAAFRTLAKTCHPDLKPGDRQAEEAFQEVQRAYAYLSNSETRKVYDGFLAERAAVERRRRLRSTMVMSATFLLTVAAVILTVLGLNVGTPQADGGASVATGVGTAERSQVEMARASSGATHGSEGVVRSEPAAAGNTSPQ
jgi:curved DNA-binding protein CbpA